MEKMDRSLLEINLLNIKENFRKLTEMVAKDCVIAPVVKANSYGLGVHKVTKALVDAGAKEFCVAYVSEGIELRSIISHEPIYLFNGILNHELEDALHNNLIPVLNNAEQIEIWSNFAKSLGKKLSCVIHIDTGMGRLGLSIKEFETFAQNQALKDRLEIKYIMSHLANADLQDSPKNTSQLKLINKCSQMMSGIKVSFANSGGIFLGKDFHFNHVRPGCAFYGINPMSGKANPMKQVVKIMGKVAQIRELEADQEISYHGIYTAKRGDVIATVLCGYADGYLRALSNKAQVYYEGMRLNVVGNVTMDMIMIDVTKVPKDKISEMKYVELLGDNITVNELAEIAGTIGYEIFTSLGNRFERTYIE